MIKIARYRISAALFRLAERCYKVADRFDPPETTTFTVTGPPLRNDYDWRKP